MSLPNKIICAGRNYAAHAEELKNPVPESPVFFMKPFSCIVPMAGKIFPPFDLGEVHHTAFIRSGKSEKADRRFGLGS
jgi:2-keto-4-pentenoate hydratase/2-oxohepta-3-ene-1,7-dioic acid hydratase in catechol pathway